MEIPYGFLFFHPFSTTFPTIFARRHAALVAGAGATAGTAAVAFPAAKGADTAEARQAAKVSHEKREKQAAKVRRLMEVGWLDQWEIFTYVGLIYI